MLLSMIIMIYQILQSFIFMIEYTETLLARINLSRYFRKEIELYDSIFFDREQLRKKAEEVLKENINVIRRNLPAKKDFNFYD